MNEHRFIESIGAESKSALREKTASKLGFSLEGEKAEEQRANRVKRYFTVFVTAFCAVCLVVAFPFILRAGLKPSSQGTLNGTNPAGGFDYYRRQADCNIKEYNRRYGTDMLYLDIYDDAEEVVTYIYLAGASNRVLYFCETIESRGGLGDLDLYIVDRYSAPESFAWREEIARNQHGALVGGVRVHWLSTENAGTVVFDYGSYKYFIELSSAVGEERVTSMVQSMLSIEEA